MKGSARGPAGRRQSRRGARGGCGRNNTQERSDRARLEAGSLRQAPRARAGAQPADQPTQEKEASSLSRAPTCQEQPRGKVPASPSSGPKFDCEVILSTPKDLWSSEEEQPSSFKALLMNLKSARRVYFLSLVGLRNSGKHHPSFLLI